MSGSANWVTGPPDVSDPPGASLRQSLSVTDGLAVSYGYASPGDRGEAKTLEERAGHGIPVCFGAAVLPPDHVLVGMCGILFANVQTWSSRNGTGSNRSGMRARVSRVAGS